MFGSGRCSRWIAAARGYWRRLSTARVTKNYETVIEEETPDRQLAASACQAFATLPSMMHIANANSSAIFHGGVNSDERRLAPPWVTLLCLAALPKPQRDYGRALARGAGWLAAPVRHVSSTSFLIGG